MQLGTRWSVGEPAPERLPAAVIDAVAAVEVELARHDTTGWRWTLTWLESRPVVELDPMPGAEIDPVVIRLDHDGEVHLSAG